MNRYHHYSFDEKWPNKDIPPRVWRIAKVVGIVLGVMFLMMATMDLMNRTKVRMSNLRSVYGSDSCFNDAMHGGKKAYQQCKGRVKPEDDRRY